MIITLTVVKCCLVRFQYLMADVMLSCTLNTPLHMNHLNSSNGYSSFCSSRLCLLLNVRQEKTSITWCLRVNRATDLKQNHSFNTLAWTEWIRSKVNSLSEWIDIAQFCVTINLHFSFQKPFIMLSAPKMMSHEQKIWYLFS